MNTKDQLKTIVERIERLELDKKEISDEIRDVYLEAKLNGFDVKALRAIVKLRKQDADERAEQEAILDTYKNALGMLHDTPLGQAATERATAKPARAAASAAADPKIQSALRKFGEPVPLTDKEKAQGDQAAFIDKRGTRVSIGVRPAIASPPPAILAQDMADDGIISQEHANKAAVITSAMAIRFAAPELDDVPDFLDRRKASA